jgi:hypothetical protein
MTESRWVARHLERPVVKVFNNITWHSLATGGLPRETAGRIALPIAGDDAKAKAVVIGLVDSLGFDGVDAGTLNESWRAKSRDARLLRRRRPPRAFAGRQVPLARDAGTRYPEAGAATQGSPSRNHHPPHALAPLISCRALVAPRLQHLRAMRNGWAPSGMVRRGYVA